jgi:hypothetical protein
VVRAARRLVGPARRGGLVTALVRSTGLSPEGVELALSRHLELTPSEEDVRKLVLAAGDTPRVAVVLSANVFVGALRAIALARAAGREVVVRPSRRDPVFARALVEELGDPATVLDDAFDVARWSGEVHVYGRDETIAAIRARAPAGVRVCAHGSGMGVAWIGRNAKEEANLSVVAAALAEDVVPFDQRGCLSPRLALVEGADEAERFADALHAALERLDRAVPRGEIPEEARAEAARYVATMTYAGRALVGSAHAVGIGPALVLPPAYRHIHVVPCASLEAAADLLRPVARAIVAVGSRDADAAVLMAPPWARRSALGAMQRPPLDGPVDLR